MKTATQLMYIYKLLSQTTAQESVNIFIALHFLTIFHTFTRVERALDEIQQFLY